MTHDTDQELLPNFYVYVNVYDQFYKIGEVEPFQYDTGKESTAFFTSVASGSNAGFKNITEIEPDDKPKRHLFQALVGVKYNMEYYFKIPTGTNRFGTDVTKSIGFIDTNLSPFDAPNRNFNIWMVKDYYPGIDAKNNSSVALTPRLRFVGFKYELCEVKPEMEQALREGRMPYKYITVGGLK